LDAADGNAALFSGKIQSPMPYGIESMYLRMRGADKRDGIGREVFPGPVLPTESYDYGNILYDGVLYRGVKMRLDLYRDQLVITPGDVVFIGIVLDPRLLGYADLRGYRIVPSPSEELPGAYYLRLHGGRVEVLKREHFEYNTMLAEFSSRTFRYYLEKDGVYHSVGKRRGKVLRVLGDRRDELRRFIRTHSLDLRRDTENALVEVVKEYERLTDR
jgi:hypothetical protein